MPTTPPLTPPAAMLGRAQRGSIPGGADSGVASPPSARLPPGAGASPGDPFTAFPSNFTMPATAPQSAATASMRRPSQSLRVGRGTDGRAPSTAARRSMAATMSASTGTAAAAARRRSQFPKSVGGSSGASSVYVIQLDGDDGGVELTTAHASLLRALALRDAYKGLDKGQQEGRERLMPPVALRLDDGVFLFSDQHTRLVPWERFYDDILTLSDCLQRPQCQAACRYRLQVLEERYNMFKILNGDLEENADRYRRGGGVFADCCKVDNHVAMETCMNAQRLVGDIQATVESRGEDIVATMGDSKNQREPQTLMRVCELLDFAEPYLLTADGLGLQPYAEKPTMRYDALDPELNRSGRNSAELLRLFLTRDTLNRGAYFAAAVRPTLEKHEDRTRSVQATEMVIEIVGLYPDEWERCATWVRENELAGYTTNRFIVSFPTRKMRAGGGTGGGGGGEDEEAEEGITASTFFDAAETTPVLLENHQQHLDNLFLPLFMATLSPEDPKYSDLALLLDNIGGFVITTNESAERANAFQRKRRRPTDVPWAENVGDLYFAYYVWANLCSLNAFRSRRGLSTLQLRATVGSQRGSSQTDTMALSYLLCDCIVDGLALESQPVMQYLYGMKGVGVCMSPLASNGLGNVNYMDHPLRTLFRRGLRVSLSTAAPLYFHHSEEPLTEEYGTACKLYRLSGVDMCEIALNSVDISSFPYEVKAAWVGEPYLQTGWRGNSFELTNVPTARLELRHDMWASEYSVLERSAAGAEAEAGAGAGAAAKKKSPEASAAAPEGGAGSKEEMALSVSATTQEKAKSRAPYVVWDPNQSFPRVVLVGPYDRDVQYAPAARLLHRALELRSQYVRGVLHRRAQQEGDAFQAQQQIEHAFRKDKNSAFDEDEWMFKTVEGVVVPHEVHQIPRLPQGMFHYEDFRAHVQEIRSIIDNIHVRNFCIRRLNLLETRYKLHLAVNHGLEAGSTVNKASKNRDFYQSTRVDNTVRMEGGMTARQLLDFIISKATNNGDDIVSHQEGKEPQTLRQLLQELNITPDTLTVDDLNVQVDTTLGIGSEQYIPEGRDELLTLLLKTDNQMKGRYFAELTKLTFENFKRDRFTFTENRLPVYGSSMVEWELLSNWFDTHGMSSFHNQWIIQIPRIYGYLRKLGKVQSFAQYLEHIFKPLWSVSLHPNKEPRLFHFVNHISGFDCVEDERRPDTPLSMATRPPHEWTSEEDPPYNYYLYHVWANIYSLNEFRRRRQFSTFSFRPSCGETGPVDHLIGGLLLANGISYGVRLGADAPLQYLFYLAQIGVTVSPLSNNTKVLGYLDNPFPLFFRRGLLATLGTDCPLMFHHTQEPLLEEYSIASKIWKLSPNDMCEIARNSVLVSGFGYQFKQERLGELFFLSSSISNDSSRTHLSDIRVAYRFETYHSEIGLLEYISGLTFHKAMLTLQEEAQRKRDFYEAASRLKDKPADEGIIDSNTDEVDLEKLQTQRALMARQLEELTSTLSDLQKQNKQLTEKLAEEQEKDRQAAQLRRVTIDSRMERLGPTSRGSATGGSVSSSSGAAAGGQVPGRRAARNADPQAVGPRASLNVPATVVSHSAALAAKDTVLNASATAPPAKTGTQLLQQSETLWSGSGGRNANVDIDAPRGASLFPDIAGSSKLSKLQ